MYLTDVYRIFLPSKTQYSFFSEAYGSFSKIDYILGHKVSLSKYKKIEFNPPHSIWYNAKAENPQIMISGS
jgi:hypothetical protein